MALGVASSPSRLERHIAKGLSGPCLLFLQSPSRPMPSPGSSSSSGSGASSGSSRSSSGSVALHEQLQWLMLLPVMMSRSVWSLCERVLIIPVRWLRRYVPPLGGVLVVLLCAWSLAVRAYLALAERIVSKLAAAPNMGNAKWVYDAFWRAVKTRYVGIHDVDWQGAYRLFGEPLGKATSTEDLWLALQESAALCNDPRLRIMMKSAMEDGESIMDKEAAASGVVLDELRRRHLQHGGDCVAHHIAFGELNAETSPGWRIGYISLRAMAGFVEIALPRLEMKKVAPMWAGHKRNGCNDEEMSPLTSPKKRSRDPVLHVPEVFDNEAMCWAFDGVLVAMRDVDGVILDLRGNATGGSPETALAVASFFTSSKSIEPAFTMEARSGDHFAKPVSYRVAPKAPSSCFTGPLAILHDASTCSMAELVVLALKDRPNTTRIGTSTAGQLACCKRVRLPNGWIAEIPNTRCCSATGESFDRSGIPPDVVVPEDDSEDSSGADRCIQKAIEFITHG